MKAVKRREEMSVYVDKKGRVSYEELIAYFQKSESTIRRDLSALEGENRLIRFWGGAKALKNSNGVESKKTKITISPERKIIGKIAASFVEENELIFIGSGLTTFAMIEYLEHRNITVITNGIMQLESLTRRGIDSFLLCGFLKERANSVVGRQTIDMLKEYRFDKVFLGATGINEELCPLSRDDYEHDIKMVAIANSKESFILVDGSKFNKTAMYALPKSVCETINIISDQIISRNSLNKSFKKGYIYGKLL